MSARITGKQFADNTITQNHLNLSTPIHSYDAARKDYVDITTRNSTSIEKVSNSNINMYANSGTTSTYLACNTPIMEDPVIRTVIDVYLNGLEVSVGEGEDCYFSPDGVVIRDIDDVRIGDRLYWNYSVTGYHLESDDILDFIYVTNDSQLKVVELNNEESVELTSDDSILVIKFTGIINQSATVIITGISFEVGTTTSGFTFDIGDVNGYIHVFTYIGENYNITISGYTYSIRWNGDGSTIFSMLEQNNPLLTYGPKIMVNYDYNDYFFYAGNNDNDRMAILGDWLFLHASKRSGIGWYDGYIFVYNKIDEEWVKTQSIYHESTYYPLIVAADKSGQNKIIIKRFRLTGSDEKAQVYTLNESNNLWEKEADLVNDPDITAVDIYGNNAVVSDRTNNLNDGQVWTFHYSGGTWWGPNTITGPESGQKFGAINQVWDTTLVSMSNVDRKVHFYHSVDSGLTWSNHVSYSGHTQAVTGTTFEQNIQLLNNKLIVNSGNKTLVMFQKSGSTWVEDTLNLPGLPLTGSSYNIYTFMYVNENIIYVPLEASNYNQDDSKIYYYQKIDGNWQLSIINNVYPNYHLKDYGMTNSCASGNTYLTAWISDSYIDGSEQTNRVIDDQYTTIITETGNLKSVSYTLPRNVRPSASGLNITRSGNTIDLTYDYSHIYNYSEYNSDIKWYTASNWATGYTQVTNYIGSTAKVDSSTKGKLISATINARDENKQIDDYHGRSNTLWIYDDDNDIFGASSLDSSIITLTIISGSIGSIGTGVYNLSANVNFSQSSTSTVWYFNTANLNIDLNGVPSYGAIALNVNGAGYSNTLSGSYNGIPTAFFTQYNIGGVIFTLSKTAGWKFYT